MKSLISRESYRRKARYSGVYQTQGGMVTDADLDERTRITQDRTDNLGDDTIKDGVPREGGAVAIAADDSLALREGVIYADGVRGILTAKPGADLSTPLALYSAQADFPQPHGPVLPGDGDQVVYADIWDRPVFALEDPYLADAGLHGAVTAFRTRTMTQVKAAPLAALGQIESGSGAFPKIGTAKLAVTSREAVIPVDDCDPCADVVSAEQTVVNALWRLEVIDVAGKANSPERITLAWSIENAAAIAPADVNHEDFERTGKVYEFYSEITESHLGVFANPPDAKRSAFVDDMSTTPSPATDHDGQPWPFVRRWDGQAVITPGMPPVVDSQMGAGFTISGALDGTIKLEVGTFDAILDLNGAAVVAGDYWLVELRRFAPETERIRLVKERPVGVLHHYCVLFQVNTAGEILPPTDAEIRKLSFPALSDLPATHVAFTSDCEKLYADADNVQEALDNLCDISAEDIAFTSNCLKLYADAENVQQALDNLCEISAEDIAFTSDCVKLYADAENVQQALDNLCAISADDIAFTSDCPELYGNAENVQSALDALCRIDFSVHGSFRLLFDWGVLCGIVPTLVQAGTGQVAVSAGAFMDRSGRVTRFDGEIFDLSKLELGKGILFDTPEQFQKALATGEACLALAAQEGGAVSVHIVPKELAFGPDDPGFRESIRRCLEKKETIKLEATIDRLQPGVKAAANKVLHALSGNGAFRGTAKLTVAEAVDAAAFNDALFKEFEKVASEEEIETLKERIDQAKKENPPGNAQGSALEVSNMRLAVAVFTAFAWTDDERMRRCVCQAIFPPCPPDLGKPPFFVPIGCLRGVFNAPNIFLEQVCPFCCRKQAMTWRSLQYFIGEGRTRMADLLARACCGPRRKEDGPEPVPDLTEPDILYDPDIYTRLEMVDLAEKFGLWEPFIGQPPQPPFSDKTTITVNDLSEAEATKTLLGNGVDVVDTIDIDDENAFGLIDSKSVHVTPTERLASGGAVRPGDKVGLLVQDGVARGYVLLEVGPGKLPFPTERAGPSIGITTEDEQKAAEFIETTNAAKGELTELVVRRIALSDDVVTLKTELETLGMERETTVAAVKEAEAQLTELANLRTEITKEIATVNEELAAAEENRRTIVTAVREGQPVTVVPGLKDPELIAKLAGEEITTVADISKLTEERVKALESAGILSFSQGMEFQQAAEIFLRRPL